MLVCLLVRAISAEKRTKGCNLFFLCIYKQFILDRLCGTTKIICSSTTTMFFRTQSILNLPNICSSCFQFRQFFICPGERWFGKRDDRETEREKRSNSETRDEYSHTRLINARWREGYYDIMVFIVSRRQMDEWKREDAAAECIGERRGAGLH